jgi:hypothetical protein
VSLWRLRRLKGNVTAEQKSASGIVSGNGEGPNEKERQVSHESQRRQAAEIQMELDFSPALTGAARGVI